MGFYGMLICLEPRNIQYLGSGQINMLTLSIHDILW